MVGTIKHSFPYVNKKNPPASSLNSCKGSMRLKDLSRTPVCKPDISCKKTNGIQPRSHQPDIFCMHTEKSSAARLQNSPTHRQSPLQTLCQPDISCLHEDNRGSATLLGTLTYTDRPYFLYQARLRLATLVYRPHNTLAWDTDVLRPHGASARHSRLALL